MDIETQEQLDKIALESDPSGVVRDKTEENLATIQRIKSLTPIDGADKIELAKLENIDYQVVVQKIHKVGDAVAYIAIDTVVPEAPWSEFLRERHFRVRTIRLKKQLSQGLIIPLSDLVQEPGIVGLSTGTVGFGGMLAGDDITSLIGVKKYEKPIPANMTGKIRGNFPRNIISITDEENIQRCSRIIEELRDIPTYVSVKLDGTSATYINRSGEEFSGSESHVCSRKLDLKFPAEGDEPNVYFQMEQKYHILEGLKSKGNFAIQGEICGPKINGNKLGLNQPDLFIFNVYNIQEKRYLNFDEFISFTSDLGFKTVPIVATNYSLNDKRFDDLMSLAESLQYDNGTLAEGIVIRPMTERWSDYMRGRISFKVVSNKFLEYYKE